MTVNYDILGILQKLSKLRPVFHSEADFQFSFAWAIQKEYPNSEIRLEYRIPDISKKTYVDICIHDEKNSIAIELKYKPKVTTAEHNLEKFNLIDQSAQDQGRYDECKDIQRIEQISKLHNAIGYSIFLTNDPLYWKPSQKISKDSQFRIHEGRILNGILDWAPSTSEGTKSGRNTPITISGNYVLMWKTYSTLNLPKYGEFRFLAVEYK